MCPSVHSHAHTHRHMYKLDSIYRPEFGMYLDREKYEMFWKTKNCRTFKMQFAFELWMQIHSIRWSQISIVNLHSNTSRTQTIRRWWFCVIGNWVFVCWKQFNMFGRSVISWNWNSENQEIFNFKCYFERRDTHRFGTKNRLGR